MDKSNIIVFVAVLIFAGFRLYQKYVKKNDPKAESGNKPTTSFPSSSKEDEYEPYAKK
jgi:hypothetical protein